MELLILYIFLTISLSFLCSILEAVLLSINTTFIKIELKEGKKYAKNLLDLKNSNSLIKQQKCVKFKTETEAYRDHKLRA